MNLFNIEEKYVKLLNEIEENDGLMTDEQVKELTITEAELETKLKSYYYLIKSTEGVIKSIEDEQARLVKVKSIKQNLVKRLKSVMRDAVILFGETGRSGNKVLDYGTIKFYTRKNEVVKVDENFYDKDYMVYKLNEPLTADEYAKLVTLMKLDASTVKYTVRPDLKKLKADLKANVELEGARIVRDDNLIIK